MIKVSSYKLKNENKVVVEDLKTEHCEEKIYLLFIPKATLKKWVKEESETSTDALLERPVYKLKGKNVVTTTQQFLNATDRDFEEESYTLSMPIPLLRKWVTDINLITGRK